MSSINMERVLNTLVEKKSASTPAQENDLTIDFFTRICEIYGLKHAAYLTVDKRSFSTRKPKFMVTYPLDWQIEYRRSFAELRDPVLKLGLNTLLPFDWQDNRLKDKDSSHLLGLSREFGVGTQGMTVPICSNDGTKAIFSVTGNYTDKDWLQLKKECNRDFITLANFIHKKLNGHSKKDQPNLTDREKEVLQLCAFGMTFNEVSDRLSITVSTVKFHLNQLRYKLDALNTTHAASKAVSLGLILMP
jgi:DNA-binding CsgD family transcriptional regulator